MVLLTPIPTRDFRSPPQPITRAKLAKNVAKTVLRFIQVWQPVWLAFSRDLAKSLQEMEGIPLEQGAEAEWRVGGRGLKLEDLILVGLEHVSMGSWQPHFRLMKKV